MKTILLLSMVLLSGCASFSLLPPQAPVVTDPQNRAPEVQAKDFEACNAYGIATSRTQSGAAVQQLNCLYGRGYQIGGQ